MSACCLVVVCLVLGVFFGFVVWLDWVYGVSVALACCWGGCAVCLFRLFDFGSDPLIMSDELNVPAAGGDAGEPTAAAAGDAGDGVVYEMVTVRVLDYYARSAFQVLVFAGGVFGAVGVFLLIRWLVLLNERSGSAYGADVVSAEVALSHGQAWFLVAAVFLTGAGLLYGLGSRHEETRRGIAVD